MFKKTNYVVLDSLMLLGIHYKAVARKSSIDCKLTPYVSDALLNYAKNGSKYWLRIQGQAIRNNKGDLTGFFELQEDITQEKENQEKIKEYESRFGLETRPDTSTIAAPFESLKQCKSQSTHSQSSGVRAPILVVRHSGVCHDRMGSPTSETSKTPY